jgi:uncharacterized membrane protein YqiK
LAIIRGAESVKAINPSLAVVTSGPSPVFVGAVVVVGVVVVCVLLPLPQALIIIVPAAAALAVKINLRRDNLFIFSLYQLTSLGNDQVGKSTLFLHKLTILKLTFQKSY